MKIQALVQIMRLCLGTELKLVEQTENINPVAPLDILHLKKQTELAGEDLKQLKKEHEVFLSESTKLQNQAPSQKRNRFEKQSEITEDMSNSNLASSEKNCFKSGWLWLKNKKRT